MYKFVLPVSLILLLLSACGGGSDNNDNDNLFYAKKPFSVSIPIGSNTKLTVLAVNGEVRLNENTQSNSIEVAAELSIGSPTSTEDAENKLDKLDVEYS